MNKEEAIEFIIEEAKRGNEYAHTDFCEKYVTCKECPLGENEGCRTSLFNRLIELLTKAEEKKETNLEHYASKSLTERYGLSPFMSCDTDTLAITLKDGWEKTFNWSDPIQWLLSPYEPPKYKLTQFEYDLLASLNPAWANENNEELCDFGYLTRLIDKGYFKDIPTDVSIGDILDNCEVIEE